MRGFDGGEHDVVDLLAAEVRAAGQDDVAGAGLRDAAGVGTASLRVHVLSADALDEAVDQFLGVAAEAGL